jgi:hypothetical protein
MLVFRLALIDWMVSGATPFGIRMGKSAVWQQAATTVEDFKMELVKIGLGDKVTSIFTESRQVGRGANLRLKSAIRDGGWSPGVSPAFPKRLSE